MPSLSDSKGRVFIETFGCQMNELDTELVGGSLKQQGYELVGNADDANVVFFNTCSVRDLSEQKVLSRLGIIRLRKLGGEDVTVGVIGCMAERAGTDLLSKNPFIDILAGPSKLHEIPGLLAMHRANLGSHQTQVALSNFKKRKGPASIDDESVELEALDALRPSLYASRGKAQAYIRITRGCNKFCSFCVVPRTRGPEVHRSAQGIIDEAKRLVESGIREITLLGQTINHYFHKDGSGKLTSFADLLFRLHEEVPELPRLRFLTSYPRDFTDEALDVMASCERICKYLHIPAQSGSDTVLKRMNRGYTREIYMSLIERAKARMPGLSIIGDMIVGFPGETDEDFEASLSLLQEVRYKNVFVFKYSTRPGTVATRLAADELPVEVKEQRHKRMLDFQNQIALSHHVSMIGKTYPILVEGNAKISPEGATTVRLSGRTTGDHIVAFDGPESLIGQIVNVRAEKASSLALVGTLQA
jgi:tRNA-2-methylthio-N6-dimethylallyladenosine synthase